MAAASIHIGVNRPGGAGSLATLTSSEDYAWKMAKLASQAGYESTLVLRGAAATRSAVHDALTRAAGSFAAGDTLFISFAGHGSRQKDLDGDERRGCDEGWCMADGVLVDDQLGGYWRLFQPGVRIVAVVESCYSAGSPREGDKPGATATASGPRPPVYRGVRVYGAAAEAANPVASCIAEPPSNTDGIRASLLVLAATTEEQTAREGLYSRCLLEVWADGAFAGSYCDLHAEVSRKVMAEHCAQHPQILMHGAADLGFPLERAFRVQPGGGSVRYRGSPHAYPESSRER